MAKEEPPYPAAALIPIERIERHIYVIRGQKVMLSNDLAELYGVPAKRLNEAVARNRERFPGDFMFQLSWDEARSLRSQIATLDTAHPRYRPYAFTEQGVAMLSAVLRSPIAIAVSVQIMRAFVRLRQLLATHADLAAKLAELESKYDRQFKVVFDAIRQLMADPQPPPKPPIGYHTELSDPSQSRPSRKHVDRRRQVEKAKRT